MDILIFGPNGQIGWELRRSLAPLGRIVSLDRHGRDGLCGDLTDEKALGSTIKTLSPYIIVNAGAYTHVDQAESEPELARAINVRAPEIMAREARKLNALLIHYSTDYVFHGSGISPWREEDIPDPVNIYGQTKLEGDEAVIATGCRHLIFRTSWVYSVRGHNFLHAILSLAARRNQLKVVNDQIGAPTGAELIADVSAHALRTVNMDSRLAGIYHLSASGETSWWGYARFLVEKAIHHGYKLRAGVEDIVPVSSEEFPTLAPRPCNSRLDTTRLARTFGLQLPSWEQGVLRALCELKNLNR